MLNDKMIKEILKNGGATLDVNYNNFNASAGYMVSLYGYEVKIDINNIEAIKKELENKKEIAQKIEVRENSEVALYKQTSIDKNEVLKWMPIVAAALLAKSREDERAYLLRWVNAEEIE